MSTMDRIVETGIFVDGAARPASNGATYDLFNPARPAELVGHAAAAQSQTIVQESQGPDGVATRRS